MSQFKLEARRRYALASSKSYFLNDAETMCCVQKAHIADLDYRTQLRNPGSRKTDVHASRRCACLAYHYARNSTWSIDTTAVEYNGNT